MSAPLQIIASVVGSDAEAQKVIEALKVAGWVCVPRDPTQAMVDAAYWSAHEENASGVWAEMIEVVLRSPGQ